jgi:hypothetical protein
MARKKNEHDEHGEHKAGRMFWTHVEHHADGLSPFRGESDACHVHVLFPRHDSEKKIGRMFEVPMTPATLALANPRPCICPECTRTRVSER